VTDFHDTDEAPEKPERTWIPRETWRQEKAVAFAARVIPVPHEFFAFDRSAKKSDKEHLWQAKRGVRKATPDTLLVCQGGRSIWFEFKAANNRPDADQRMMLTRLQTLGHFAAWGRLIEDLGEHWERCGAPMVPNWRVVAMQLDALVDGRIAKEEAKQGRAPVAKRAARRAPPGKQMTVAKYRKLHARGFL
jgi:hypothetical protein